MGSRRAIIARIVAATRAALVTRRGGTTIEYGMILAFIVLAMFGAFLGLADTTKSLWFDIASQVTSAR